MGITPEVTAHTKTYYVYVYLNYNTKAKKSKRKILVIIHTLMLCVYLHLNGVYRFCTFLHPSCRITVL